MKNYSNRYTFIFASIMVVVVAAVLSVVSTQLQPLQKKNQRIAKMTDILKSVNKTENLDEADNKDQYIEDQYEQYIVDTYVLNSAGKRVEGTDAFQVDMAKQILLPHDQRKLPVYVCELDNGERKYILPLRGKGLWGPIWGYISLNDDFNTVYGAVFDHQAETPGLGAEITTEGFQQDFNGKKIFDEEGNFIGINVYKGGDGAAREAGDMMHGVDGVSGGTITSNGVENMVEDCLRPYISYFKENSEEI